VETEEEAMPEALINLAHEINVTIVKDMAIWV